MAPRGAARDGISVRICRFPGPIFGQNTNQKLRLQKILLCLETVSSVLAPVRNDQLVYRETLRTRYANEYCVTVERGRWQKISDQRALPHKRKIVW